jgi:hypothetical protein
LNLLNHQEQMNSVKSRNKMNYNKLALAALAGTVMVGTASADQTFHLYGSTAYRKATFNALNLLVSGTGATVQFDTGAQAVQTVALPIAAPTSAELGSTNLIWKGQLAAFGSQNITIYANWAGSVAGVQSLADPGFGQFTHYLLDGGAYGSFSSGTVDVAMSDVDQNSTPFTPNIDPTFVGLNENFVSVLEFIWAKGNGGPASLSNVGAWSLQALLGLGNIPVSQFTGTSGDATNMVYLTGRNDQSGTRNAALTDSFYGPAVPVIQYNYTNAPGVYGYKYFGAGDGFGDGFDSGGSVKAALIAARPANYVFVDASNPHNDQSYLMGYISVTDALNVSGLSLPAGSNTIATVTSAGVPTGQWLSYNGVQWSEPAIEEGAYTYFTYEHLDYKPTAPAAVVTFAGALKAEQINQAGSSVVPGTMPLTVMNIQHRFDGTVIAHN